MLIDRVMSFCDSEYRNAHRNTRCEDCLHTGDCSRNCKDCLEEIHYPSRHPNGKKFYDCPHLINFYVCDYAYKYATEIYYLCINRLDFGKKYCRNSPTVEESILQRAVMAAIMKTAARNTEVLQTLKLHIGMGLEGERSEDNSIDLQVQIAEIDAEFRKMLDRVSTETVEAFDEETATRLMNEKSRLQQQLGSIADAEQRRENAKSRLDDIYMILDGIKNRPMEYDDQIVRQLLECMVVDSKERITVIFKGGIEVVQPLTE